MVNRQYGHWTFFHITKDIIHEHIWKPWMNDINFAFKRSVTHDCVFTYSVRSATKRMSLIFKWKKYGFFLGQFFWSFQINMFILYDHLEKDSNCTFTKPRCMYSLTQKHCTEFSNEKSMVFSVVNIFKILPASSYVIYSYTYKVKKLAADGKPDL